MSEVITCQACSAKFADNDAYQIHLGIGAPAFHRCDTAHEMQVKGMYERRGPVKDVWCIPSVLLERRHDWAYLKKDELKRYFDAVKAEAKQYCLELDEPVRITDVWVSGCDGTQIDIDVSWERESAKDELHDDMRYTVVLEKGSFSVWGPEW